jgi:hypothetical protein
MLPRLEAEESNLAADRTAIGTGAGDARSRRAVTQRWARQAAGELEAGAVDHVADAAAAAARAWGGIFSPGAFARIPVRKVPAKGK